jgi:hypothetical protein
MANQVKTYRVLHDGMRVGDSVRNFGDLMPEAAGFSNLRAYINAGHLEELYVDQSVLDDWDKELKKRLKAKPETDDSDELDEGDNDETVEVTPKKKTVKKTVAKKRTVAKKGKANDGAAKRLAEQSV